MDRRQFLKSVTGGAAGLAGAPLAQPAEAGEANTPKESRPRYRAGVIGLGWTGLLYDLAERTDERFDVDDVKRPTPELDIHRRFHHHTHPGNEGNPTSYAEALWDRPEVELVAGGERDVERLRAFGERYGIKALYTDGVEMMRKERLDIVAICTNTKGRAFLTVKAAELGVKAIFTEKPMAHTLEEADRMVKSCADRNIPLCCGAITTTHPSFSKAKELIQGDAIGDVVSIECGGVTAQHQNWMYFLQGAPSWVVATDDEARRDSGSSEFRGQGVLVTSIGEVVHYRKGARQIKLSGTKGEMTFHYSEGWRIWRQEKADRGVRYVETPWPSPQFLPPYGAIYCLDDIIACLDGQLDEPKNSGRRVAQAIEVELALKESARRGNRRIDLPLADRSLGLHYDWFR